MKLDIIVSSLPPKLDGIGDYSARLAAELGKSLSVRVLTRAAGEVDAIPGVRIERAFTPGVRRSVFNLVHQVEAERPD